MLGLRDLNRTLLLRQHLVTRTSMPPLAMIEHLIGLQAQDNLPPYLSLAARIDGFDPHELSDALERRDAVRILTMRGTIHVLTPHDALSLRPWVQPALDQQSATNQMSRPARGVPVADLVAAARELLAERPLPVKELGLGLSQRFPDVPTAALVHVARERVPMVQVPPRGLWKRSGGVVYQTVENHLGRPLLEVDLPGLVRRYLFAFGPATAADMTTWSRVTRLGPLFTEMAGREELVVVECEDGKLRYDVPGAPYLDGETDVPVRLLGSYDNVWLSLTDRARIAPEEVRGRWMGPNGGVGRTVFVDGFLAGLWFWEDGRVRTDLVGRLTAAQKRDLADEVERVSELLTTR